MPSIGQENLETVMIDFFGALRRGDFEAAAGLLDPDVSWQGLREEWVCHGREEVIDTFRWGSNSAARSTHSSSPGAASRSCSLTDSNRRPLLTMFRSVTRVHARS